MHLHLGMATALVHLEDEAVFLPNSAEEAKYARSIEAVYSGEILQPLEVSATAVCNMVVQLHAFVPGHVNRVKIRQQQDRNLQAEALSMAEQGLQLAGWCDWNEGGNHARAKWAWAEEDRMEFGLVAGDCESANYSRFGVLDSSSNLSTDPILTADLADRSSVEMSARQYSLVPTNSSLSQFRAVADKRLAYMEELRVRPYVGSVETPEIGETCLADSVQMEKAWKYREYATWEEGVLAELKATREKYYDDNNICEVIKTFDEQANEDSDESLGGLTLTPIAEIGGWGRHQLAQFSTVYSFMPGREQAFQSKQKDVRKKLVQNMRKDWHVEHRPHAQRKHVIHDPHVQYKTEYEILREQIDTLDVFSDSYPIRTHSLSASSMSDSKSVLAPLGEKSPYDVQEHFIRGRAAFVRPVMDPNHPAHPEERQSRFRGSGRFAHKTDADPVTDCERIENGRPRKETNTQDEQRVFVQRAGG